MGFRASDLVIRAPTSLKGLIEAILWGSIIWVHSLVEDGKKTCSHT